jgi:hypothetical protein
MKAVVAFCPIDAKDNSSCGYNPVAFCKPYTARNGKEYPGDRFVGALNRHNQFLQAELEAEYLTRLHSLQMELKEKYEPLFDNTDTCDRRWADHDLSAEARATAKEKFPGDEADYYD